MRAIRWTTSTWPALRSPLCAGVQQTTAGRGLLSATNATVSPARRRAPASTQQAMNRIKSLAGNWVAAEPEEGMTGIGCHHRVTLERHGG